MQTLKKLVRQVPPFKKLVDKLETRERTINKLRAELGHTSDLLRQVTQGDIRTLLANKYIRGSGIEIGAKHIPLVAPLGAKVRYLDHLSTAGLIKKYPEVAAEELIKVDIVDDGEKLTKVKNRSQDFIIANHFIEHTLDPIATLTTMYNRLKPEGILYLAVPDKRLTFDKRRDLTPTATY